MSRRRLTMAVALEDLAPILRGEEKIDNIGPRWEVVCVAYRPERDELVLVFEAGDPVPASYNAPSMLPVFAEVPRQ